MLGLSRLGLDPLAVPPLWWETGTAQVTGVSVTTLAGLSGTLQAQALDLLTASSTTTLAGLSGTITGLSFGTITASSTTALAGLSGTIAGLSFGTITAISTTTLAGLSGTVQVQALDLLTAATTTTLDGLAGSILSQSEISASLVSVLDGLSGTVRASNSHMATLTVPLSAPDGSPLVGVVVHAVPLVAFGSGAYVVSELLSAATTDADGIAVLRLPRTGAYAYRLTADLDERRMLDVELRVPTDEVAAPANARGHQWH